MCKLSYILHITHFGWAKPCLSVIPEEKIFHSFFLWPPNIHTPRVHGKSLNVLILLPQVFFFFFLRGPISRSDGKLHMRAIKSCFGRTRMKYLAVNGNVVCKHSMAEAFSSKELEPGFPPAFPSIPPGCLYYPRLRRANSVSHILCFLFVIILVDLFNVWAFNVPPVGRIPKLLVTGNIFKSVPAQVIFKTRIAVWLTLRTSSSSWVHV